MTTQDARERAFQLVAREYVADESFFNAGWDAAKREDEQLIGELVAAIMDALDYWAECPECAGSMGGAHFADCKMGALRALAGSEERSSAG